MPSGFIPFRNSPSAAPPERFTFPFKYEAHPLVVQASAQLQEELAKVSIPSEGKMFGVLIVKNESGEIGFLSAFSGRENPVDVPLPFAPLIFDAFTEMEGFADGVREVTRRSEVIEEEGDGSLPQLMSALKQLEEEKEVEIERMKLRNKQAKAERDLQRQQGVSPELDKELRAESSRHKEELIQLKRKWVERLDQHSASIQAEKKRLDKLREDRMQLSSSLQKGLFQAFNILNANGDQIDLSSLFESTSNLKVPPAGAGECAAPKMLHYAFVHQLKPLCFGEFWWGPSPQNRIRVQGDFYPACIGRCEPILGFMLQGIDVDPNPMDSGSSKEKDIEILHEDEHLIVLVKPEGLLSVPGRKQKDSVQIRLQKQFPEVDNPRVAHRLDMGTSGIMIATKHGEVLGRMHQLFLKKRVEKQYEAILDGELQAQSGEINLPLAQDFMNRPNQMVCYETGKESLTHWERIEVKDGKTRVRFYPKTGRTHQLRVHSAHQEGLSTPIVGDGLYGKSADRLYLHAAFISFRHPMTGETMEFRSKPNF